MKLLPSEYECLSTVEEAMAPLARRGDAARPLAGRRRPMPIMAFGLTGWALEPHPFAIAKSGDETA